MRFEFATVTRIIFGSGTVREAGRLAREWGQQALVVTGKDSRRADLLLEVLAAEKIGASIFRVETEPSLSVIAAGLNAARGCGAEMIIGLGGGSVIDAAKAMAGLFTHPSELLDFLEIVGQGKPLTQPALPWMAIPTTSGTGAEVTRNAVLSVPERGVKVSLRSPLLLARVAIIDPELTLQLSPLLTASTGMDALTQLIEAYVCLRANPLTDGLCVAALPKIARSLPRAWENPTDLSARSEVSFASLSSGLALANAGLGAVHGFAAALGGRFNAPHGAICAILLAPVMAANVTALRSRSPQSPALRRYDEIAQWLTGEASATVHQGIAWIEQCVSAFKLHRLSRYGVNPSHTVEIVARTEQASSTKGNPLVLTGEELARVLLDAL